MQIEKSVENSFYEKGMNKKYLLAMSGGIDSTVLFDMMQHLGLNFAVAHVNYGLRGEASDLDERWVYKLCQLNNVKCYTKKIDVAEYKLHHNESTQSAARILRYEWFLALRETLGYDYLISAHHLDDSIETFFINLLRGTGLRGLTGIENNDTILRPLLTVSKQDILSYAKAKNLEWREDESNAEDVYLRNKIRNNIIPAFKRLNPNFNANFLKTLDFLKDDVMILEEYVCQIKSNIFIKKDRWYEVDIQSLKLLNSDSLIFYLFESYGFKFPKEIMKLMDGKESAEIVSNTHRLIKNREKLILIKNLEKVGNNFKINDLKEIFYPIHIKFHIKKEKPKDNSTLLDFNKVKFPLSLRLRQSGDMFYPKGMNGKSKKISKFFKDLKLSKIEKENTWLLCDADDQIIWVVGKRFDERFLQTKETTKWLEIEKPD